MFCPMCKSEYIEGVTTCRECSVSLVTELPASPDLSEHKLVTVLEAANEVQLDVARSILDAAGIRHITRSEGLQDICGAFVGQVELQVAEDDFEEASALLQPTSEENETDG